jgi:HlyD family secretion protein
MTIADLNEMEARVDIGEVDVVLIAAGQKARLEVDAFKDRKFNGTVTEIANSSGAAGLQAAAAATSANNQEATKFSVKIRIQEKEQFRPGMSVTAEIETRYRTNVLTVPIASVTTRIPKPPAATNTTKALALNDPPGTNSTRAKDTAPATGTNVVAAQDTNFFKAGRRNEPAKPVEVVFVVDGDHVKMVPVKIGISDDLHWEITDGLKEGDEVISGGYRAVSRDLEDGKKIKKGAASSPGDEAGLKKTE